MGSTLLATAVFLMALLYSSVGHAGASGYISVMALAGIPVADIRPAALIMNLGVSVFGMWHFFRGKHLNWRLTWPFLVTAIPASLIGGMIPLPPRPLGILLGAVLLFSATRFLLGSGNDRPHTKTPPLGMALPIGAALGLLAGLTGTGGGIFLTPLLLLAGWANAREAAATSIVFIAANSLSGIIGYRITHDHTPWHLAYLFPFALVGGFIGSRLGSFHLPPHVIRKVLSIVMLIAAAKLLFFPAAPAKAIIPPMKTSHVKSSLGINSGHQTAIIPPQVP